MDRSTTNNYQISSDLPFAQQMSLIEPLTGNRHRTSACDDGGENNAHK